MGWDDFAHANTCNQGTSAIALLTMGSTVPFCLFDDLHIDNVILKRGHLISAWKYTLLSVMQIQV